LAEIVEADASSLIAFGRLDKFSVLSAILDRAIVSQAVYEELRSHSATPDASALRAAAWTGMLTHESRTLTALRDTLLPKLVSGEPQAKDAEKFIGKAV
jgi:predicted nucleic acid-binding protein